MSKLRVLLLPLVACVFLTANAQGPTTLQLGTPVERAIGPGQIHEFTITLEENSFVQFVVEQRGIDVVVKVSTPAGKTIGEYDSPNGTDGPEHVSFVGVAAGSYRITVQPLEQGDTTSTGRYQIKLLELRQASEQEIKASKNQDVVKAKGIALLAEIEGTIPEIKSPFTRIRAQLKIAQLLWDSDEKRATKNLSDATTGVKELLASVDGSSAQYAHQFQAISQLRFEILNILTERDPDAALSFLYSSVPPPNPYGQQREQSGQESMLELSIANRIAGKDPNKAYQIAKQVLKTKLSGNLMTVVTQLRRQNPELATELVNEIASKLLKEKLSSDHDVANLALGLLRSGRSPARSLPENSNTPRTTLLPETQYRELLQKVYNEALAYSQMTGSYNQRRDVAWGLLNGLQNMGPELDTLISGGAAAVQARLKELTNQQMDGGYDIQRALSSSPVDAALETIAKAPPEQREQLYMQLAGREAGNGDIARARQIINERISNPFQRRNALTNVDQQEMQRAMSKGNIDEALRIISGFRTPSERAALVAQIATQIGPGQKRANAINLLEQAKSLLGPSAQAQDQDQMGALIEIARAFGKYDPKRSFEILDPLVDQMNELCAAARTLEGFGTEYYADEELDLENGNSVGQMATRVANVLGALAVVNFDRARAASDRLRLPELRLRAYVEIAQQTIQVNADSRR